MTDPVILKYKSYITRNMNQRESSFKNSHTRSEQWFITVLCKKAKKNAKKKNVKKKPKKRKKNTGGNYGLVNHEKNPLARKGVKCNN